jgi:hypothetical protein
MCMKCGCSTPNDKVVQKPIIAPNGGKGSERVVPPTDTTPGGYGY